jgi:hypothetical protein
VPEDTNAPTLSGLCVADFSRVLAGPYATMMLADFGADVITIESPDGDDTRQWLPPVDGQGESTYFGSVNRNKRSVVCDLGTEVGLAAARRLAETADVVVENFRPGVMDRFGLGFDPVVELSDAAGTRASCQVANPIHLAGRPAAYRLPPPRLGENGGADWLDLPSVPPTREGLP